MPAGELNPIPITRASVKRRRMSLSSDKANGSSLDNPVTGMSDESSDDSSEEISDQNTIQNSKRLRPARASSSLAGEKDSPKRFVPAAHSSLSQLASRTALRNLKSKSLRPPRRGQVSSPFGTQRSSSLTPEIARRSGGSLVGSNSAKGRGSRALAGLNPENILAEATKRPVFMRDRNKEVPYFIKRPSYTQKPASNEVEMTVILGLRAGDELESEGSPTKAEALAYVQRRYRTGKLYQGKHVALHLLNGKLGGSGAAKGNPNLLPAYAKLNSRHETYETPLVYHLNSKLSTFEKSKRDSAEFQELQGYGVRYTVKASRPSNKGIFDKLSVEGRSGTLNAEVLKRALTSGALKKGDLSEAVKEGDFVEHAKQDPHYFGFSEDLESEN